MKSFLTFWLLVELALIEVLMSGCTMPWGDTSPLPAVSSSPTSSLTASLFEAVAPEMTNGAALFNAPTNCTGVFELIDPDSGNNYVFYGTSSKTNWSIPITNVPTNDFGDCYGFAWLTNSAGRSPTSSVYYVSFFPTNDFYSVAAGTTSLLSTNLPPNVPLQINGLKIAMIRVTNGWAQLSPDLKTWTNWKTVSGTGKVLLTFNKDVEGIQ